MFFALVSIYLRGWKCLDEAQVCEALGRVKYVKPLAKRPEIIQGFLFSPFELTSGLIQLNGFIFIGGKCGKDS